jgi:iron complex transport system ATP-binding protein
MIEVKNITHSYGPHYTLKDVSLYFEEEKITGIIGANGAGKSTLLSVISRLIRANSGDVMIDGKNMKEIKNGDIAKKLAILKQFNHINLKLTIRELVSLGRFPHSKGRLTPFDNEKIDEALMYLSLEDIQDKYIDELSGGQKQRAFLAMIIAQDTKYVLLDEPLNNLDLKYASEMMEILRALVRDYKKTILIVLHDINFASAYCDQIVAMKDGYIVKVGDTNDVIDKKVIDEVFNHDFKIAQVDNQNIIIYHQNKRS